MHSIKQNMVSVFIVFQVLFFVAILSQLHKKKKNQRINKLFMLSHYSKKFNRQMIPFAVTIIIIYISCIVGIAWGIYNAFSIYRIQIKVRNNNTPTQEDDDDELSNLGTEDNIDDGAIDEEEQNKKIIEIGKIIAAGSNAFLFSEYLIQLIFVGILSVLLYCTVDQFTQVYCTIAFILGSIISMLCGFIGMRIAVLANYRTASRARDSLHDAFQVAFRAGNVMGFMLVSISLAIMTTLVIVYIRIYNPKFQESGSTFAQLFEYIAGYGLGGSAMALFGRVGGGIYTKAADVGADLVGKLEQGWNEDHPKNPATIADNVGDNVGDIAGMGSDLFGSFAEATCAALVVSAAFGSDYTFDTLFDETNLTGVYFPLILSAFGIFACLITAIFGIWGYKVNKLKKIEIALRIQLAISTIIMLIFLFFIVIFTLPSYLDINRQYSRWYVSISAGGGLITGFIIGMTTDYYTSNAHRPVREIADSCRNGTATNIIYGLALGYQSTVAPIIFLAITAFIANRLLGMYGVALAALGMLSTLCIGLTIDAYGPISDNAGGISEMAKLPSSIRKKTDALDAAGNTTAAIGKGFAIGSAALVSLSLFGAFLSRAEDCPEDSGHCSNLDATLIKINNPLIFSCLLIGGMLPYFFSALTMKSVGKAAILMANEARSQIKGHSQDEDWSPDYKKCISVSTKASLKEMIAPGCLVIFVPLLFGVIVGPYAVAGLLPGALISGIQLAISMSNSGGAWDNAKKYIESGRLKVIKDDGTPGETILKGTRTHEAAVSGDTVGDPLKDTSGPSLNILVKLMAIISLVFASFYVRTGFLQDYLVQNKKRICFNLFFLLN